MKNNTKIELTSSDIVRMLTILLSSKIYFQVRREMNYNCVIATNFSFLFFRTVKFWDLETFQLVSTTDAETSGIR